MSKRNTRDSYLKTHEGKKLLAKHTLNEKGLWQVTGEDTSCGGPWDRPNCPDLGVYEGTLNDVIDIALDEKRFFSYGSGGKIELVKVKTALPSHIKRRKELRFQIDALRAKIESLEKEYSDLEG